MALSICIVCKVVCPPSDCSKKDTAVGTDMFVTVKMNVKMDQILSALR